MDMIIFCYRNIKKRSRAQSDCLIRKSAERYYAETGKGCPQTELTVLRTPSGKPYFKDSNLFVGVTHTKNLLFVGVSRVDFGIDAEDAGREIRQKDRLMKRFYSKEEQAEILALPVSLQREQMLRVWVQKEALLKYRGIGVSGLSDSDTKKARGVFRDFSHQGVIGYLYSPGPVTYQMIVCDISAGMAE